MILFYLLLLAGGMVLVIYGGDIFVDSSILLAKKTKIPTIIIGATIVSIATTLPELIVSTLAAGQGSFDLAVGNAAGSIICNTALIAGLSMAIIPTKISEKSSSLKYFILIGCSLLLIAFSIFDFNIQWYEALIFELGFIAFMTINIFDAIKQMRTNNHTIAQKINDENKALESRTVLDYVNTAEHIDDPTTTEDDNQIYPKTFVTIFFFIIGAAMIALGAYSMVDSATYLAEAIGISEGFIGLTIVAIGTSLPELITTITAIKKKNVALGYGNIIGANIFNLTLIMGACGLIAGSEGLTVTKVSGFVSIPLILIISGIFVLPMFFKNRSYRWQGIALLSIYGCYMAFLTIMTILGYQV